MKIFALIILILVNLFLVGSLLWGMSGDSYLWHDVPDQRAEAVRSAAGFISWLQFCVSFMLVNFFAAGLWTAVFLRSGFRWFGIFIAAVSIATFFALRPVTAKYLASRYLVLFEQQAVTEQSLIEPIKEAGHSIGPLLISRIQNRKYERRRYAIVGLGEIGYIPAIPVLEAILRDDSEAVYIRADSFLALRKMGTEASVDLAARYWGQLGPEDELRIYISAIDPGLDSQS